ncbi:unnamed protein product, partial [Ostreobium quekettii]
MLPWHLPLLQAEGWKWCRPNWTRFKGGDRLPAHVDRSYRPHATTMQDLRWKSEDCQVTGSNRHMYFRRPVFGGITAQQPAEVQQRAPVGAAQQQQQQLPDQHPYQQPQTEAAQEGHGSQLGNENGDQSCDPGDATTNAIGTQTDMRESEAQTLPWQPECILPSEPSAKQRHLSTKRHCQGPEVLQLQGLTFGGGLPAGLQEVDHIDKLRAKRAFESALPPLNCLELLPLRLKKIEGWETKEWEEREEEIMGLQEERLRLLDQAIACREQAQDERVLEKLEERKSLAMEKLHQRLAGLQKRRNAVLRHLTTSRKKAAQRGKPARTWVQKYADSGSNIYAPLQREGRFPHSRPKGQEIATEAFQPQDLKRLGDLEKSMAGALTFVASKARSKADRLAAKEKKRKALLERLESIYQRLETAKDTAGRGSDEAWPCPLLEADANKRSNKGGLKYA